ncbi:sugar transferase [Halorarum salinum]|uniref:Sugar transferase n=1 Tax=Halorarum salinum TaxID=2743089 RepID=A0A7D5QG01_9EURY|nr:sugar transferase [Halobaculum salinum]QLG61084.1 sugar transferase [Halobaculum salinum]
MNGGWRYRLFAVLGVAVFSAVAVALVNNASVQSLADTVPVLSRLSPDPPGAAEFTLEILTTVVVFVLAFLPLYKPRPRRILDVIALSQKRVLLAMFALATVGYFDYTYRLPRLTVLLVTPILFVALPAWFAWIRRRPTEGQERAIVVGDDPKLIQQVAREVEIPLLGYLCPTKSFESGSVDSKEVLAMADGGETFVGLTRLGGLSRIEDVLVEYDINTVVLAFEHADRAEFFGALDACYEHGVAAKVHRNHADSVLTSGNAAGTLVDVEVEPWDVQDYMVKRAFDVVFSVVGLVVLAPVALIIAVGIKVDDGGPVLYEQERTAVFGETFDVYKFRSMVPKGESSTPVEDAKNNRITDIGQTLRRTHLDEIPQLWSILRGDMSVVGPRAVWTNEEMLLEDESEMWRKRWFVKPGLTGLAQVEGAKSTDPAEKLRLDLEYVRRQSFGYDVKMVLRQVWQIMEEVTSIARS